MPVLLLLLLPVVAAGLAMGCVIVGRGVPQCRGAHRLQRLLRRCACRRTAAALFKSVHECAPVPLVVSLLDRHKHRRPLGR